MVKHICAHTDAEGKPAGQRLITIYDRLFACYGPQRWWPAEEPFEVMVGAILTQSTSWTNVEKAIRNLKSAKVLNPQQMRALDIRRLADLIRPSGYYNVKARKLKELTAWLKGYNDNLQAIFSLDTTQLRNELISVYGIGEETADSILLYAAEKPVFVIDAYTRRILDRCGIIPDERTYSGYQRLFMENLPHDVRTFNEYHALLVRHGKTACRKQPWCEQCCLLGTCSNRGL